MEWQVKFLGSLAEQELAGLLQGSQVLVAPPSHEGFAIVYLVHQVDFVERRHSTSGP
jgi:hypothetical protein